MEGERSRRVREISPERLRRTLNHQEEAKTKKPLTRSVQVVYYLTRNGQLEHPHFMEVVTPASQPLRLRDVMKRLKILRGKGMPSLYSWSCKRSYRNGYVWNDLAEDDVIYPSDNMEYVLKGSELVEGCSERSRQLQMSINRPTTSCHMQEEPHGRLRRSKPKPLNRANRDITNRAASFDDRELLSREPEEEDDGDEEEVEEYEIDEPKTSYTSSTTPRSRYSRGVSTEEFELPDQEQRRQQHIVINKPPAKPIPTNSFESARVDSADLPGSCGGNVSKRFEDGDPVESGSGQWSSGSVLLQLISCGNIAVAKAKNASNLGSKQKDQEDLRKGVLRKNVANKVMEEEDRDMIRIMSENPRFGNSQTEEKEYFSGSIVETVSHERVTVEPVLRKSNSFNEERGKNSRIMEEEEEKMEENVNVKGRCIPRKKASWSISSSKHIKN